MNMLHADYKLYSVDLSTTFYRDPSKPCGFLIEEAKKVLKETRQKTYLGGVLPDCIDEIGGGIDFLLLDTMHLLPGEFLDFLVALPYLTRRAVVVLHDICLNRCIKDRWSMSDASFATKLLLSSVYADKYLMKEDGQYPNIGAFRINGQTKRGLANVISTLSSTWYYGLDEREGMAYVNKIMPTLDDECKFLFRQAIKTNYEILNATMIQHEVPCKNANSAVEKKYTWMERV